jgi:transcriptional regulator with XRE-family HTH domain
MSENMKNAENPDAGGEHEFLPLDFSVPAEENAKKQSGGGKVSPGNASLENSGGNMIEKEKTENQAHEPSDVSDVFPEEKTGGEETFPEPEHNHGPEIERIKKKFEEGAPDKNKETPEDNPPNPQTGKNSFSPASAPDTGIERKTRKTPVKITGSISTKNATAGQILQEARVREGMSLNQVEQRTKIKLQYIETLERDDAQNLPPMVYVNAYIKNLCSLYNISKEDTELILKKITLESEGNHISEEIINHLEDEKQISPEQEQSTRKITWLITAGAIAFILLVTGIVMLSANFFSGAASARGERVELPPGQPSASTEFKKQELEKLIIPRTFFMDELETPMKRGQK